MGTYATYPVTGGGGSGTIPTYPNAASLPATATDGSAAITTDTDTLYIYNAATTSWKPVANPSTINAITNLTGDGTANGPGSAVLTLATVNVTTGSFGSSTSTPNFVVNGKGLITAAASTSIQIAESQVTNLVSDLAGKQPVGNYITALTSDVSATGPGSAAATINAIQGTTVSGTTGSANVVFSTSPTITGTLVAASQTLSGTLVATGAISGSNLSSGGHAILDVPLTAVGAANGVASLDSGGKVPVSQLPATVMEYQGAWDASTNTPTLVDGTGANGNVYRASVAGTVTFGVGNTHSFNVGDLVIYSSAAGQWQYAPAADGVSSVNGMTGAVTVNAINQLTSDITAGPASGSASAAATVAAIQGKAVSGTTGTGNVVFSAAPTLTGLLSGGSASFSSTISASNLSGTNTGDVTLGTANGLSLSSQVLSLGLSGTSATGALSSTDWNTFNGKQAAGNYITALTGDVVASGPGSASSTIQSNVVSNAKLAQMATLTIKGNNTGSTANASDLTVAQVNAILPVFTATLNGLTPLSGGGTTNYLRADGTWAPVSGGSGTVTSVALTAPSIFTVSGSPVTTSGTLALSYSGTALPIANGGTNATSASAGFNNLSPMTTAGDIIIGGTAGAGTRLAVGSNGKVLTVSGGAPTWAVVNGASTVFAKYFISTNQSIGAGAIINFDSVVFDPLATVTTGVSWKFTAPVAGPYLVTCSAATTTASGSGIYGVQANTSPFTYLGSYTNGINTGSTVFNCAINDTIWLATDTARTFQGGMVNSAYISTITITLV